MVVALRWVDMMLALYQKQRYIMGVEIEGIGNRVEIHELHCKEVLGQDTRLQEMYFLSAIKKL